MSGWVTGVDHPRGCEQGNHGFGGSPGNVTDRKSKTSWCSSIHSKHKPLLGC